MEYYISTDKCKIDLEKLKEIVNDTYWAASRTMDEVKKSVDNSICYGVYRKEDDQMIAITRVITDYASTCYICDVIVDKEYRGKGIGSAILKKIVDDPIYDGMKKMLITKDAHEFYEKFGFEREPSRYMWINNE